MGDPVTYSDIPQGFQAQSGFSDIPQGFALHPDQPKGFFGREGDDISNRYHQAVSADQQAMDGTKSIPRAALDIMGAGSGAVGDLIGNLAGTAARNSRDMMTDPGAMIGFPTERGQAFQKGAGDLVRSAGSAIMEPSPNPAFPSPGDLLRYGQKQAAAYPDQTAVAGDILNIASAVPGIKAIGTAGDAAGQLAKTAGEGIMSGAAKTVAPDIKALTKQAYALADAQGGQLAPSAVNNIIAKATEVGPKTPEVALFTGTTPTTQAIADLSLLKDKPLSLQTFEGIDKELTNRIDGQTDALGIVSPDGRNLIQIRQHLRDAADNAAEGDLVNNEGFASYKQARQLASTGFREDELARIYQKAESADVPQTVIKNGFARLRDSGMNGYTPEEQAAIRMAAKTGIVTGALKIGGSRLISGIVGAAGGAAGGGIPGSLAGATAAEALAYPLRKAAGAIQAAKGAKVSSLLLNRPVVQEAALQFSPAELAKMPTQDALKAIEGMRARVNMANNLETTLPDQLALPAPETVYKGNQPSFRTNAEAAAAEDLSNSGLTPDVLKVQQSNLINKAWENKATQETILKDGQLRQLYEDSSPQIQEMLQKNVTKMTNKDLREILNRRINQ